MLENQNHKEGMQGKEQISERREDATEPALKREEAKEYK